IKLITKTLFLGIIIFCLFLNLSLSSSSRTSELAPTNIIIPTDMGSPTKPIFLPRAASVIFSQVYEINDDFIGGSSGDDDNFVDAGETIELRLQLENDGDQGVTDVYANLTSGTPYISISSSNQSYIQIAVGETSISTSYYIIEFDSILNASDIINFDLEITSNEGIWFDSFTLTIVGVSDPVYFGHIVSSESNGDLNADNDDIIDPGELIQVRLYSENQGGSILFNVYGYLSTSDPFVTITDDYAYFGTIYEEGDIEYGSFSLDISGACPELHTISFNLSLIDDFSNWWNFSLDIVVSGFPEYEITTINFLEYSGDGDSYMDAGEAWHAEMTIRNIGDAIGVAVDVFLGSNEPLIEFNYINDHNVTFGNIEAGFSDYAESTYDWRFTISDQASEDQFLDFFVSITDTSGQSAAIFNTSAQVVGVANYELNYFEIVEDCYYSEDCNDIIDAGDTYTANISISNIGEAIGNEILVYLYSSDEYVEFYYENGSSYDFDSLDEGMTASYYGYYDWEFTISEKAKTGHILNFTIVVVDASLREWHFYASLTVADGPSTFYYTPMGKAMIFGGTLAFIAFCIFPYVRKRIKPTLTGLGLRETLKEYRENQKKNRSKKRKQRNKERAQKQKQKEAIRQKQERERIADINANEKKLLEKFENILEMSESVNTSQVAKSLGLSKSQLFEKLIRWQEMLPFKIDGEFIEVDDTINFTQSVRESIAEMSKYYSCYQCGFPIERSTEVCPDCKSDIPNCVVCKLPISFGDEIGSCSLCEAPGHLSHLQEWVKTQGKCPVCLQKLPVEGIVPEETKQKKK
ncbi:MAG: hypothetical protein ACTSQF_13325, partial [Candidatus Heimdallarchaeaceae archaeon]